MLSYCLFPLFGFVKDKKHSPKFLYRFALGHSIISKHHYQYFLASPVFVTLMQDMVRETRTMTVASLSAKKKLPFLGAF